MNWLLTMAGRPPLRIGQHGKVTRKDLGGGVWLARCRFRDADGVTRIVERRSAEGDVDKHGKAAEDALIASLKDRRSPGVSGNHDRDEDLGARRPAPGAPGVGR